MLPELLQQMFEGIQRKQIHMIIANREMSVEEWKTIKENQMEILEQKKKCISEMKVPLSRYQQIIVKEKISELENILRVFN